MLAFRPVVDGRALPEPPIDAIRGGLSREVAVLAGYTRDEWKLFSFMDPQAQKSRRGGPARAHASCGRRAVAPRSSRRIARRWGRT